MQVILAFGQSGVSNFALSERQLRKNALCLNQSTFSNFALYVINKLKLDVSVSRHIIRLVTSLDLSPMN